ncbi:MAG: hypothetical protein FWE55_00955 [Synergistaceae bacterium]|nr:hypothetical protein [Synergistaceae bacterium]
MPHVIAEIRRKLSRIFLGRIVVRELSGMRRVSSVKTYTHHHSVEVVPMRVEPRVKGALFVEWRETVAKSAGSLMGYKSSAPLVVSRVGLGKDRIPEVTGYKFTLKRRALVRNAIGLINKTPSQRNNRINFLKTPPKMEHATLLALYSPLYQERVSKSALDKSSGNLLFWYDNKRVKTGEKYHLLLLRVFGGGEPLKWVWLPADKKIG